MDDKTVPEMMAAVSEEAELVQRRLPDVSEACNGYVSAAVTSAAGTASVAERLTGASAHVS